MKVTTMTDVDRIDWLEQHKVTIQHHDYGVVGPWYIALHGGGHSVGKTFRETVDKLVRSTARRQREREQAEEKKGITK